MPPPHYYPMVAGAGMAMAAAHPAPAGLHQYRQQQQPQQQPHPLQPPPPQQQQPQPQQLVYVNPKQLACILRRRAQREKQAMQDKLLRARKVGGCGGGAEPLSSCS